MLTKGLSLDSAAGRKPGLPVSNRRGKRSREPSAMSGFQF
jgi:hypothetical protein